MIPTDYFFLQGIISEIFIISVIVSCCRSKGIKIIPGLRRLAYSFLIPPANMFYLLLNFKYLREYFFSIQEGRALDILRDTFLANIPVSSFKVLLPLTCSRNYSETYLLPCLYKPKYLISQVRENNFRPKCIYVAVMLRRMMEAILNKDTMDDKVL